MVLRSVECYRNWDDWGVNVEIVKVTCNAAADFQEDCVVDNIACNWDKMIGLHIMVLSLFQRVFCLFFYFIHFFILSVLLFIS